MFGPPGTGKTLALRAVAVKPVFPSSASQAPRSPASSSGSASSASSLFRKAQARRRDLHRRDRCLGGRRGRNQLHNEDDRTLNQLLVEMDGFSPSDGVVVIAATNRSEDSTWRSSARAASTVRCPWAFPLAPEREAILRPHATNRQILLAGDVDLARLARLMPQTSGAELANLLNEAAIVAARAEAPSVDWSHIEAARDRLLLARERRGFQASDREWRVVAMHEAGHALLGVPWAAPTTDCTRSRSSRAGRRWALPLLT